MLFRRGLEHVFGVVRDSVDDAVHRYVLDAGFRIRVQLDRDVHRRGHENVLLRLDKPDGWPGHLLHHDLPVGGARIDLAVRSLEGDPVLPAAGDRHFGAGHLRLARRGGEGELLFPTVVVGHVEFAAVHVPVRGDLNLGLRAPDPVQALFADDLGFRSPLQVGRKRVAGAEGLGLRWQHHRCHVASTARSSALGEKRGVLVKRLKRDAVLSGLGAFEGDILPFSVLGTGGEGEGLRHGPADFHGDHKIVAVTHFGAGGCDLNLGQRERRGQVVHPRREQSRHHGQERAGEGDGNQHHDSGGPGESAHASNFAGAVDRFRDGNIGGKLFGAFDLAAHE